MCFSSVPDVAPSLLFYIYAVSLGNIYATRKNVKVRSRWTQKDTATHTFQERSTSHQPPSAGRKLFIPTLSGARGPVTPDGSPSLPSAHLSVRAINMNHPPHTHINPPPDIQRVKPPPPPHTHTSLPLHLSLCHPRCC